MNKILVTGSSGKVGRVVVEELKQAGERVRTATRNPVGPDAVELDWNNPATFQPALAGVNRVFLMSPSSEPAPKDFLLPFLAQAADGRRKIVLMSEGTTDVDETAPMRPVETAVQSCGSPYVILRPNWFMDNFHTLWLGPILEAGIIPVPAADSHISFIDSRDIAAAATAALCSDRFDRRVLTITGPTALNFYEAAQAISAVSGRNVTYVPIDDVAFRQSLLATGLPSELVDYLSNIFAHTRRGLAAAVTPAIEDLCGRPPHTFADYASHRADAWK